MGMNRVILQGNLDSDPKLKSIKKGKETMCILRLATDRTYKSGNIQETDHFNVACFGALSKYAVKHLEKGSLVSIEGKLRESTWYDPAGNRKTETQIVADLIHHNQKPIHSRAFLPKTGTDGLDDDDLPEIILKPARTVTIDGNDIPEELLGFSPEIDEILKKQI